jgi:hypothetical protein
MNDIDLKIISSFHNINKNSLKKGWSEFSITDTQENK